MKRGISLFGLLFAATLTWAAEVAGVNVPDQVQGPSGDALRLNGAGVRSKFFIKIYVGALYLPQQTNKASEAISMPGNKRVLMHFVYDDVSAKKITQGWKEGFSNNLDQAGLSAIAPRLESFNGLFEDMAGDDRVVFDYVPAEGTRVSVKGVDKGVIEGEDFMRALLSVWLGDEPADARLKAAMLGLD